MPSRAGSIAALIGLLTLAAPVPARVTMASLCTGGGVKRVMIPARDDDPQPDDCVKACHALCEGRKKPGKRAQLMR